MSRRPSRVRTRLLTGVPRSGTSLCCRLAGRLPGVVALNEPIDPRTLADVRGPQVACCAVRAFAATARAGLLADGRAPSVQVDGRLSDDRVAGVRDADGLRRPLGGAGEIETGEVLAADFVLVVKHNALFAALLGPLSAAFPVLALVRNPVAVLASWETVDLPVRRGRVPMGERFDPNLAASLDAEPDALRRRVLVLRWFFARYRAHVPAERVLRYEDVVAEGGLPLFRALGVPGAPEPLGSRNANALYDAASVDGILATAEAAGDAWAPWYRPADLRAAAAGIRREVP